MFSAPDSPFSHMLTHNIMHIYLISLYIYMSSCTNHSLRCSYINVCATFFAAGADYGSASGSISFTSSQASASYSVDVLPDKLAEGLESFGVNLSDIGISLGGVTRTLSAQEAGRLSLQPSTAIVSIDDDDRKFNYHKDVRQNSIWTL